MVKVNYIFGVPKYTYLDNVKNLFGKKKNASVCYLSLNKTARALLEDFKKEKLPGKNVFFVDGITSTVTKKPADTGNIVFVDITEGLDKLRKRIELLINAKKSKIFILDSLTTMQVYHKKDEIERFVHEMITFLSIKKCDGYFLIATENLKSELVQSLESMVDKVDDLSAAVPEKIVPLKKAKDPSKSIVDGDIIIGKTDSEQSLEKTTELLKEVINKKGFFCLYVTFNRPFSILKESFKKAGVKTDKMFFFDTVTRLSMDMDSDEQCAFLDSPTDLEYLQILIRNKMDLFVGKKAFLILDTLTNVLNYNTHEKTIMFLQSLTNRLRLSSIGGNLIVISQSASDENAYEDFRKFVDFSVKI